MVHESRRLAGGGSNLALRVFAPFAFACFWAAVFRVMSAVIAPDLARDLELSAAGLGLAVSAYFLGAALLQLPLGVLLDRYDLRVVFSWFLVIAAAGSLVTAMAADAFTLAAGRILIAFGVATSFVAAYKAYAVWYPSEKLTLVNGMNLAVSGLGMMAGTVPVEAALTLMDWRTIHIILAGVLLVCAATIYVAVPSAGRANPVLSLAAQIDGFKAVLGSWVFWRTAPLVTVTLGSFVSLTQLWGGLWTRDVAGMTSAQAATMLLLLSAAITVAGVSTGGLAGLCRRVGISATGFCVGVAALFAIAFLVLTMQWAPNDVTVYVTWTVFGFLGALNWVNFAALAQRFPAGLIGRLNACLTLFLMLATFVLQSLYGIILDAFPQTQAGYSQMGHRVATATYAVMILATIVWFALATRRLNARRPDGACRQVGGR